MRTYVFLVCLVLFASVAQAQTPAVGNEILTFDIAGPDIKTVSNYAYNVQDGTSTAVPLANVTCSGSASPFVCGARLPALTTGLHSLTVQATTTVNGQTLASARSAPLALLIMAVPAVPQNLRIQ